MKAKAAGRPTAHGRQIMDSDRGNIVNFASFRKTRREEEKRADKKRKEETAAAHRVKFGRSGAQKKRAKLEEERRRRELEGKQIQPSGTDTPDGKDGD
ncbi:DUF4169 family protein [Parvibaculum sp.]|uniref:DUF4169 family protein n=1 Tax=Parvibaculum sp. TaxID=2024848 RepID=UPI001B2717CF|nr:DUF4169 family protein [Parvibaculum sp.]MBO6668853.1 DUF4169 family protein [Parvibaculum sp.]MBO6692406.1 DUF4169 family protein [Parvibaculum sp.]MBO6715713.1 DUF4169 family protein [Parvibaculum sp.]